MRRKDAMLSCYRLTSRSISASHLRVLCSVRTQVTAAKPSETKSDKNVQPQISSSFVMNMFRGRAVTDNILPFPVSLSDERKETLQMFLQPTEKFLQEVDDPFKNDEMMDIPKTVLDQFAELGAFGALVPEEYEGAGLNNTQMARLAEVVGAHDLSLGVVMGAHQSIGYKGILLYGTEDQKKKYLPDLATGRKYAAFCLTEPTVGSDAASVKTRAEKTADGKYYIINGGKLWISNGNFADVFTVFAQTPMKGADGKMKDKVSAFIVERKHGGVTHGQLEKKMGIKGSNTVAVNFDNTKVPVENLLGVEGEGFKIAMNILNNGRFGIPAACTGSMKHCIKKTIDHITQREQFGKKLMEFGNVQEQLTDMITRHYATESVTYMLASNMDKGITDYQLEAAIAKVMASENAWKVCDAAIQLHGGMGFMKECGLEMILRDLRVFRIFEGANDILRLFVALTGIQYAGKHLQHVAKQIKSGSLGTFIGEAMRRATGNTGCHFDSHLPASLKESGTNLNTSIARFGKTVETLLMKHKKAIIERQFELIRIADAAIDIYCMAAVLSRCIYTAKLHSASAHEEKIAKLFCLQANRRVTDLLNEISSHPDKEIGMIHDIAMDVCKENGLVQMHPLQL
ncbi:hypothetical protein AB6A40_000294 [Gnathostoma spinigerum]|uniref:Uncharacterized protein n=1 Tax=Gnathostoma spinigerum TaxID=75299 RepID=A0ABD6E2R8_9BILA